MTTAAAPTTSAPTSAADDLARAECERSTMLFADKQLAREGRWVELVALRAKRLRTAVIFAGALAGWSLVMATVLFLSPARESTDGASWLTSPRVGAWLRLGLGVVMLAGFLHALHQLRRCRRVLRAIDDDAPASA